MHERHGGALEEALRRRGPDVLLEVVVAVAVLAAPEAPAAAVAAAVARAALVPAPVAAAVAAGAAVPVRSVAAPAAAAARAGERTGPVVVVPPAGCGPADPPGGRPLRAGAAGVVVGEVVLARPLVGRAAARAPGRVAVASAGGAASVASPA